MIAIVSSDSNNASASDNGQNETETVLIPTVATPAIHPPPSGHIVKKQSIQITCATAGATIYYTLNGTTPTTSSIRYTGYFLITNSTTVKAAAFKTSYNPSGVAMAVYTK